MNDNIKIEPGKFGQKVVLQSEWSSKVADAMRRGGIRELEINYARGFTANNIEFLRDIPFLEALTLITYSVRDISAIHSLVNLRAVDIGSRGERTPIDFAEFPALEDCGLEWRAGSESLFTCKTLRRLWLNKYSHKRTTKLSGLVNLEELYLGNSPIDCLDGLSALLNLRRLGLYYLRCLDSVQGIRELSRLTDLDIRGCKKIRSITDIRHLTCLVHLTLADGGTIDTLQPLSKLLNLRTLLFYGSTNVADGDMTPILRLPRLHEVAFMNRRHYSHRREYFERSALGADVFSPTIPNA